MIVLDASVALYATGDHPLRDKARAAIASNVVCVPDIFTGEVANALARMVRTRRIGSDLARSVFETTTAFVDEQAACSELVPAAFDWAIKLNHGVFDLIYVELARRRSCVFLTADTTLAGKLAGTPLAPFIRDLADWDG